MVCKDDEDDDDDDGGAFSSSPALWELDEGGMLQSQPKTAV